LAAPGMAQSLSADLERAEALIDAGEAEQAWRLLTPHELQQAGDPRFDYLLGIAALESGKPDRATFILERVIAVNPGHGAAHLELARSHFALRDFERAEREFNAILNANPTPGVRAVAQRYLQRMRSPQAALVSPLIGYVEMAVGRDTNVNAATAQSSIFLPQFGTQFFPGPDFTPIRDRFTALGGGFDYSRPLDGKATVIAGADFRQRVHADAHAFDATTLDTHIGLRLRLDERDTLRVALAHNVYELGYDPYRRMQSAAAEWSRAVGLRARILGFVQGQRIRYVREEEASSSSDLIAIGAGGGRALDRAARTFVFGRVYIGNDNAVAERADGDRHIRGATATLQRSLTGRADAYVSYSLLGSHYQQENPAFGTKRRDLNDELALGAYWRFANGWVLRPQVVRIHNRSNIALDDFKRTEVSLTLRRVWQ
jgi:tetratricopeptide (TPR) repeat protein